MGKVINKILSLREFDFFFNRLYSPLCLFANTYVNDVKDSEDIVQDVFIKVWEKKIFFENQNKVEGFFYIAVKNKSLDFLRSKHAKDFKAYSNGDLEILQKENHFIKEIVIIKASILIENAINSLSPKCAVAMRLGFKGYTNKEIAVEMEISIETVKRHKKIAYKVLRKTLGNLKPS